MSSTDLLDVTTMQLFDAINAAKEAAQSQDKRPHLGASLAGNECKRKIWNEFRWIASKKFSADTLRRFADGHASEDIFAEDLERVVEITDRQWSFKDGHLGGSIDGFLPGGVPGFDEPMIWEHKCIGADKWKSLNRKLGEYKMMQCVDRLLLDWNFNYYSQAQIYMHYKKVDWHFITVASAGTRDIMGFRTPYDDTFAYEAIRKAKAIAVAMEPPSVLGGKSNFPCSFCDFSSHCYEGADPLRHCRSCRYVTPRVDGVFTCSLTSDELSIKAQKEGCKEWTHHL